MNNPTTLYRALNARTLSHRVTAPLGIEKDGCVSGRDALTKIQQNTSLKDKIRKALDYPTRGRETVPSLGTKHASSFVWMPRNNRWCKITMEHNLLFASILAANRSTKVYGDETAPITMHIHTRKD